VVINLLQCVCVCARARVCVGGLVINLLKVDATHAVSPGHASYHHTKSTCAEFLSDRLKHSPCMQRGCIVSKQPLKSDGTNLACVNIISTERRSVAVCTPAL
jgi:hypothetical protein